jgi:hypothetical protein
VEKQTKTQEKISGEREMEKSTRHRTYSGLASICVAAFILNVRVGQPFSQEGQNLKVKNPEGQLFNQKHLGGPNFKKLKDLYRY